MIIFQCIFSWSNTPKNINVQRSKNESLDTKEKINKKHKEN